METKAASSQLHFKCMESLASDRPEQGRFKAAAIIATTGLVEKYILKR
jgi:hypothetical protein